MSTSNLCSKCRGLTLRTVTPRDLEIYDAFIVQGLSYAEIARTYSVSLERIRQIVKKVRLYTGKEDKMKKDRLTAMLPPVSTTEEQRTALENIAIQKGASLGYIIRQACSEYIRQHQPQQTVQEPTATTQ